MAEICLRCTWDMIFEKLHAQREYVVINISHCLVKPNTTVYYRNNNGLYIG